MFKKLMGMYIAPTPEFWAKVKMASFFMAGIASLINQMPKIENETILSHIQNFSEWITYTGVLLAFVSDFFTKEIAHVANCECEQCK